MWTMWSGKSPPLSKDTAITIILAAKGYPGTPSRGGTIAGIDDAERTPGVIVFHAGTASSDGRLAADGGRVLAVTAVGANLAEARERAYQAVGRIDFADGFCRSDIGWRELERLESQA